MVKLVNTFYEYLPNICNILCMTSWCSIYFRKVIMPSDTFSFHERFTYNVTRPTNAHSVGSHSGHKAVALSPDWPLMVSLTWMQYFVYSRAAPTREARMGRHSVLWGVKSFSKHSTQGWTWAGPKTGRQTQVLGERDPCDLWLLSLDQDLGVMAWLPFCYLDQFLCFDFPQVTVQSHFLR